MQCICTLPYPYTFISVVTPRQQCYIIPKTPFPKCPNQDVETTIFGDVSSPSNAMSVGLTSGIECSSLETDPLEGLGLACRLSKPSSRTVRPGRPLLSKEFLLDGKVFECLCLVTTRGAGETGNDKCRTEHNGVRELPSPASSGESEQTLPTKLCARDRDTGVLLYAFWT